MQFVELDPTGASAPLAAASASGASGGSVSAGGSLQITNPNELPGGMTFGKKTYLLIRANFSDDTTEPVDAYTAYETLRQVDQFYTENSYGKFSILPTVTPLITLPKTLQWYKANDDLIDPDATNFWRTVKSDALASAKAAGYDPADYDFVGLRCFKYEAPLPSISGYPMMLANDSASVWAHELGHNIGHPHANSTNMGSYDFGSGAVTEYGNNFDNMGTGSNTTNTVLPNGTMIGHNNITFKNLITQWLPDFNVQMVNQPSGTYRIHAMDFGSIDPANKYGLRMLVDEDKDVYVEFRQNQFMERPFLWNGVTLNFSPGWWGSTNETPGSGLIKTTDGWGGYLPAQEGQGVLLVGQTARLRRGDIPADIFITPIAKNNTTPPSIDVVVNIGDFNAKPDPTVTVSVSPVAATYSINQQVTFTATASDPTGATLAYFWDFEDTTYSTDNRPTQTHSWTTRGTYRVRCIVSDMKGHRASQSVLVKVVDAAGQTGDYIVSGTCTDASGGVGNVKVSGTGPAAVYSDSNGFYAMNNTTGGVVAGSKAGYRGKLPPTPGNVNPVDPFFSTFEGDTPNVARNTNVSNANLFSFRFATVSMVPSATNVLEGQSITVTATRDLDVGALPKNPTDLTSPYGYWYNTATPVTVYIPDPLPGYISGGPYGIHSPGEVLSLLTVSGGTASNRSLTAKNDSAGNRQYAVLKFTIPANTLSATITLSARTNTVQNVPRVIEFLMQSANGANNGTLGSYTPKDTASGKFALTILDANGAPPTATLKATSAPAIEGGASGVFTLSLDKAPATDLPIILGVPIYTGGQTGSTSNTWGSPISAAAYGTDYIITDVAGNRITLGDYQTFSQTFPVTVNAGQTSATFNIVPLDNGALTPNRVVEVVILNATNASYLTGRPNRDVINIQDKNPLPVLSIEATTPTITEGAEGIFTVRRTGDNSKPLTVPYSIHGSALNGFDYKRLYGSVTFNPGESAVEVSVQTLGDGTRDNGLDAGALTPSQIAKLCILALKSDSSWSIDFNRFRDTITILDGLNDKSLVSVETGNAAGSGGGFINETAGDGWFHFSRMDNQQDLVVNYTITGTAVANINYAVVPGANNQPHIAKTFTGTITIPRGYDDAYVHISAINDLRLTANLTLTVTLTPSTGYLIDPFAAAATIIIADNTILTSTNTNINGTYVNAITLTSTNRTASEATLSPANFYIARKSFGAGTGFPLTVNFSMSGTGIQGVDYNLVDSGTGATLTNTVTIPTNREAVSINVVPIGDNIEEGTLKVTMTSTPPSRMRSTTSAYSAMSPDGAPVCGSRTWMWTIAAPAFAASMAEAAISSGATGTAGFTR